MGNPTPLILVIDDEQNIRKLLKKVLERRDHRVVTAASRNEGLERFEEELPDLCLIDVRLGESKESGMELVKIFRRVDPTVRLLVMTGHASVDLAVEAMRLGATDFIEKPFEFDKLYEKLDRALTGVVPRESVLGEGGDHPKLVGQDPKMREICRQILQVAQTDNTTVLITGETGTGKEVVAQAIHEASKRTDKRLVKINCAALTETLLESELFGHEKGAFTGALHSKPGLFEVADGGTLFLDEVGEMGMGLQAKLLRALQEREITRVGGIEPIEVDTRVIASTNRKLKEEVNKGNFRKDLFYRLRVVPIEMPPLRKRRDDIPILANHFLREYAEEFRKELHGFTDDAILALKDYPWPGNVRELKNVVEYAAIIASDAMIKVDDLRFAGADTPKSGLVLPVKSRNLKDLEKELIQIVLKETDNNRTEAAKRLGIDRSTLYDKLKRYDID